MTNAGNVKTLSPKGGGDVMFFFIFLIHITSWVWVKLGF
jgi:hypothetical protein